MVPKFRTPAQFALKIHLAEKFLTWMQFVGFLGTILESRILDPLEDEDCHNTPKVTKGEGSS